ncbi:MAG: HAD family phosphatase [Clostridiales bacterium]|nr:HAD family phosphatase [Clostridiales bacterium]
MIKAFIFDMDGVIIDSEPLHIESDKMVGREFGIELTDEELLQYVGMNDEWLWSKLAKKYKINTAIDEILEMQYLNKIKLLETGKFQKIKGVDELISDLRVKGIKTALASSSAVRFIQSVLDKLELTDSFEVTVSGEDVENGKPAPDIFLRAAELLNVSPKECVVLEDAMHGINGAKKAGMKCIGFKNPNSGNQDLSNADKIVYTLEGLDYENFPVK